MNADVLSRAELDRYDPQPLARGGALHYLCPYCGDAHARDNAHRKLKVWPDGGWHCIRCERSGKLAEHWTRPPGEADDDPLRPERRRRKSRPAPPPPTSAELAERAAKREHARRLLRTAVPLDAAAGAPGLAYLEGRAIPAAVAQAAGVLYHPAWPGKVDETFYRLPAVVFPMCRHDGRPVALDGRWIEPPTPKEKARTYGTKGRGVFLATPTALDCDGPIICEGAITALSIATTGYAALALGGHDRAPAWLARRLAFRTVLIAFDKGETGAEAGAARVAGQLAALGARPFVLWLPAEHGDWNDYLRAAGRDAVEREVTAAMLSTWGR